MKNTSKHTQEVESGLQKRKVLKPWEVATKSFRTEDGRIVDVEHASDAEFQAWIVSQGIPVEEDGIIEWSFEDRFGVISYVLHYGLELAFYEDKTSEKTSDSEVFEGNESASEAV